MWSTIGSKISMRYEMSLPVEVDEANTTGSVQFPEPDDISHVFLDALTMVWACTLVFHSGSASRVHSLSKAILRLEFATAKCGEDQERA